MIANPTYHKMRPSRPGYGPLALLSAILLLMLVVSLVCAWLMVQTVASYYDSRIYPNVYVMGMKLGQLTPAEATTLLDDAPPKPDTGVLVLTCGQDRWSVPWFEAGMRLDVTATIEAAFAIGHSGDQSSWEQTRTWLRRHDVAPMFSIDPAQAQHVLERLAPSVAIPPTDAALELQDGQLVVVPARPGRELDVQATLAQLLATSNDHVELVLRTIPPHITDVGPAQVQAEDMLRRRIELSACDVLTDETLSWTLDQDDIITWLRITPSPDGPTISVDRGAVQTTLAELADGSGNGRGLQSKEATGQVLNVFETGGGAVTLYLTHPARTHVVRPGDTLSGVASAFGMPAWLILQANPQMDPNWLHVGQELVIPSQDLLTPYPPVPGKRVVVSIAEQRMYAFENGKLVFDWPVSTGIAESPTHSGVFQVLSKEENAYASLWDLWMPHFLAIYPAGPDFYNGIHGLPTLSSGRRLWEGLLGSPASYGCIILGLEEAETFYRWAEVGVVVVIE